MARNTPALQTEWQETEVDWRPTLYCSCSRNLWNVCSSFPPWLLELPVPGGGVGQEGVTQCCPRPHAHGGQPLEEGSGTMWRRGGEGLIPTPDGPRLSPPNPQGRGWGRGKVHVTQHVTSFKCTVVQRLSTFTSCDHHCCLSLERSHLPTLPTQRLCTR